MIDSTTIDVLVDLLAALDAVGIRKVIPEGNNLRLIPTVAIPAGLLERVREHKPALLAALRPKLAASGIEPDTIAAPPIDLDIEPIDVPPACPSCNGIAPWWDGSGRQRCLRCNPPTKAVKLLEHAERLRRQYNLPAPAGAVEMLGGLKTSAALQAARCCVGAGKVDVLDQSGNRPV